MGARSLLPTAIYSGPKRAPAEDRHQAARQDSTCSFCLSTLLRWVINNSSLALRRRPLPHHFQPISCHTYTMKLWWWGPTPWGFDPYQGNSTMAGSNPCAAPAPGQFPFTYIGPSAAHVMKMRIMWARVKGGGKCLVKRTNLCICWLWQQNNSSWKKSHMLFLKDKMSVKMERSPVDGKIIGTHTNMFSLSWTG